METELSCMDVDLKQLEEPLERWVRQKEEADKAFVEEWGQWVKSDGQYVALTRDRYWALLKHWLQQLREARQRGLPQFTLSFVWRPCGATDALDLALESLVWVLGYNRWRYSRLNPRRASSDMTANEDYNDNCRALIPMNELTVYFH